MSSELVATGSAKADGSRRTDEAAWEQAAPHLPWPSWPPALLTAAPRSQPLADLALRIYWDDPVIDGVPHELAVTWRAHADGIFVARTVCPKGSTRWVPLNSAWYPSTGVAARTSGLVPATVRAPGAVPDVAPTPSQVSESRQAAGALDVLPIPVQAGVLRAVPEPDVWIGCAHEEADVNGTPWRYTSRLLRMDARRAVVISAHKGFPASPYAYGPAKPPPKDAAAQLVGASWQVTQLVYDFAAPAPAELPQRRRRLAIGRR